MLHNLASSVPLEVGAGGAVTGIVTWLIGKRKSSGAVRHTDAGDLWGAMRDFHVQQAEEIKRLQASEQECLSRCAKLSLDLAELAYKHRELNEKYDGLRRRLDDIAARAHTPDAG